MMAKRKARESEQLVESILRLIEAGVHRKLHFTGCIIDMKTGVTQTIPDRISDLIEDWSASRFVESPAKKARKKK